MNKKRMPVFQEARADQGNLDLAKSGVAAGEFIGVFTDDFRRLLAQRREECGLSISQISNMLDVDPSTYRKWEGGTVAQCRNCNIRPVRRFLMGDLTSLEKEPQRVPMAKMPERFIALENHFKSLLTILSLLDGHPELEERLLRGFEEYCEDSRLQLAEALINERKKST